MLRERPARPPRRRCAPLTACRDGAHRMGDFVGGLLKISAQPSRRAPHHRGGFRQDDEARAGRPRSPFGRSQLGLAQLAEMARGGRRRCGDDGPRASRHSALDALLIARAAASTLRRRSLAQHGDRRARARRVRDRTEIIVFDREAGKSRARLSRKRAGDEFCSARKASPCAHAPRIAVKIAAAPVAHVVDIGVK